MMRLGVVASNKRRNMRRIKREIVILQRSVHVFIMGVCIVNAPCQCYFKIYGFQCAAKASLKVK